MTKSFIDAQLLSYSFIATIASALVRSTRFRAAVSDEHQFGQTVLMRVLGAAVLVLALAVGCRKTKELESANGSPSACDVTSADHDTLFWRGAELIKPHMLLLGRKTAPRKDDEVHVGVACLDRVLDMDPTNWSALWLRGKGLQSLGEHGSAVASFRAAYRLKPDQQDVARELAEELLETQQFGEAVTVAREVSTRHPDDAGLAANLALALVMNGDVAGARQAIADALRLDPNDAITKLLAKRIAEVADGSRPAPKSINDLQRDR